MSDDILARLKDALADRYRIDRELEGGGMAVVYVADDLRHARKVAIKVLKPALSATVGTERFLREIDVLAGLQHPHILTLIDSGQVEGLPYYVMPFVEGQSLAARLEREGALPVEEAVRIAAEVADALEYAHARGVIHRDVKPGNVLLSGKHAVVADFGIAAALDEAAVGRLTATGVSLGSPAYMSPEQASGETDLDARTDVYSLGCVLYEMLTGTPPFEGPLSTLMSQKVLGKVEPVEERRPEVPREVARVVERAMEIEPEERFASAGELREALLGGRPGEPPPAGGRRRTLVAGVAIAGVAVVALVAIRSIQAESERAMWASQQLAEVEELSDAGRFAEALALAEEVEAEFPADTTLQRLLSEISFTVPIRTNPPGAEVRIQRMTDPEDEWEVLGTTPLKGIRFAGTTFESEEFGLNYFDYHPARVRFELAGHRPRELLLTALLGARWRGREPVQPVELTPDGAAPEGMVRIRGFTRDSVEYGDYFMDRHEVTNAEFGEFVDAGGYENPAYWEHPFVREGEELDFEEAMGLFEDQTGRSGPATWRLGSYSDGRANYPVRGVSWHEAAAYARWAGKELPTRDHWQWARLFYRETSYVILPRSNLGTEGPRPVGRNRAMTALGVYDLVGNVREWVYNPAGPGRRATLGGSWTDARFSAGWTVPRPALDRDPRLGFRLVLTPEANEALAALREPVEPTTPGRDYFSEEPASDAEFAVFERLYDYDPVPLDPAVERTDTAEHWVREIVTFDLPYGARGRAALYLPRNATGPLQPVLFWGGAGVKALNSIDEELTSAFDYIVRSGRAVVVPVLAGTYGRPVPGAGEEGGVPSRGSVGHRDLFIRWVKDFRVTLDYLETREEIGTDQVGYFGFSWGGITAPVVLAVEPRIDAAVLNVGGLSGSQYQPEVDPFNFVTRVDIPLLMISGEHDTVLPYETSQLPMYELLGTDPEHKEHYVTPAAHLVPRDEAITQTLDWFDRYLGKPGAS